VLEPNGTFFVKGKSPSSDDVLRGDMMKAIEKLSKEVHELRKELGR
jgi:hypothetical protein